MPTFISSIPTQIECSEELCVIRITFIFSLDNASNKRFENPGIPTMPLPSRLSKASLVMLEIPRMLPPFFEETFSINVPDSCGAKVFFIQTGMRLFITGCMVGG